MIALRVLIRGRVQGVGYRAWVVKQVAQNQGIAGWVRNLPDGQVEALFQGPEDLVRSLVKKCQKGPLLARVDGIEERLEAIDQELKNHFKVLA